MNAPNPFILPLKDFIFLSCLKCFFLLIHHMCDFFPLETILLWLRSIFSPRMMGMDRILGLQGTTGHSTLHSLSRLFGNAVASCVLGVGCLADGRKAVAHNLVTQPGPLRDAGARCKIAVMPWGHGLQCSLTTHPVSKSISGPGWRTFALRFFFFFFFNCFTKKF